MSSSGVTFPLGDIDLTVGALNLTGAVSSMAKTPASSTLSLTGDMDVRWYGTLTNLKTAAYQTLVAKRGGTTASWVLREDTAGKLELAMSTDGTTLSSVVIASVVTPSAPGYRATRRQSDGRVQFFFSDSSGAVVAADGSKWTQIGADQTGTTSALAISGDPLTIGALGNGTMACACTVAAVEVRSGIDGTLIAAPNFAGIEGGAPFTDSAGRVWSVLNATVTAPSIIMTKGDVSLPAASLGFVVTQMRGYSSYPFQDRFNGYYIPRGFGPMSTPAQCTAAIQAAVDAASTAGGGTVFLDQLYTVAPSPTGLPSAIALRSKVRLLGSDWLNSGLRLAGGANVHLVGSPLTTTADEQDQISFASVAELRLDGNSGQQDGLHTHDLLHLSRFARHQISHVYMTAADGNGYYSKGLADVAGTPRSIIDGVVTWSGGAVTIQSATAAFTSADVGAQVLGGSGVPYNVLISGSGGAKAATIASVTNATTAVLTIPAGSGTLPDQTFTGVPLTITPAVASSDTQTERPIWMNDVWINACNGWGLYSSATNRQFHGKGIHVEGCGIDGSNEWGGAFLDHSEDIISGLSVQGCHGDGIHIHNVQGSHYDNLHAVANDGFGIFVREMVNCSGRDWFASANAAALQSNAYRTVTDPTSTPTRTSSLTGNRLSPDPAPTSTTPATSTSASATSAEVYFAGDNFNYGVTRNTVISGIHAPGDKGGGIAGPWDDNRRAAWGVYVEDGITLDVGAPTDQVSGLRLVDVAPGDGGVTGTIRTPA